MEAPTRSNERLLLVIGSGPGIGRHVASTFISHGFSRVALVARKAESLQADLASLEALQQDKSPVGRLAVQTYQADITEEASFGAVLERIGQEMGRPECVLFNAASVTPTALLGVEEEQMIHAYKVSRMNE